MLISQHINSFRLNNKQHKASALLSGVKRGGGVIERERETERKRMNELERMVFPKQDSGDGLNYPEVNEMK